VGPNFIIPSGDTNIHKIDYRRHNRANGDTFYVSPVVATPLCVLLRVHLLWVL